MENSKNIGIANDTNEEFLVRKQQIIEWINTYYDGVDIEIERDIKIINGEFIVNYEGDVRLKYFKDGVPITSLTNGLFKWGEIKGSFDFYGNFTSFNDAPRKCTRFGISDNQVIKNLEGSPVECDRFECYNCFNLISLKGSPQNCNTYHCCNCNSLTTLKGAPQKCEEFKIANSKGIKSLKGGPQNCKTYIVWGCDGLESLGGMPQKCKRFGFYASGNIDPTPFMPKGCKRITEF